VQETGENGGNMLESLIYSQPMQRFNVVLQHTMQLLYIIIRECLRARVVLQQLDCTHVWMNHFVLMQTKCCHLGSDTMKSRRFGDSVYTAELRTSELKTISFSGREIE